MDPYFHHYRRPNTYIPLPPQYNHHHLRQVPNHVLVNPTAFNFNPPVFLPANPLFVPQVPVLSNMIRVTVVQCCRSLLQILTLAAVLPGSVTSALRSKPPLPCGCSSEFRYRIETLLGRGARLFSRDYGFGTG
ncbi:uncharacterized protein DS421_12g386950 [Arachis hypogaea]|nr:uncharacterized protein DS421_12g386950 [Arachis hypogaea]